MRGFLWILTIDSLFLAAPFLLLPFLLVMHGDGPRPGRLGAGTITLTDGTVIEVGSPDEAQRALREYRGRIRGFRLQRQGGETLAHWLGRIYSPVLAALVGLALLAYGGWREFRHLPEWLRPELSDLALGPATGLACAFGVRGWELLADRWGLVAGEDPLQNLYGMPGFLVVAVLVAPLGEEIYFRGRLQEAASRCLGSRAAWVLPVVPFVLLHPLFPGRILVTSVAIGALGLILAWLREKTGRLVAPILAHAFHNGITLLLFLPGSSS